MSAFRNNTNCFTYFHRNVFNMVFEETLIVYHLHGQTARFTVWVNGRQNSGLVNFVPESRLPFVQISFIFRKTAARRETGVKDDFEEMEHEFSVWNILCGKRTTFSDVPLLPEIFRWSDPESRVPFTFQPDFPEAFCK